MSRKLNIMRRKILSQLTGAEFVQEIFASRQQRGHQPSSDFDPHLRRRCFHRGESGEWFFPLQQFWLNLPFHVRQSTHPFCGISAKNQGNATIVVLSWCRPLNESVLAPTFGTCLLWNWAHPFCSCLLAHNSHASSRKSWSWIRLSGILIPLPRSEESKVSTAVSSISSAVIPIMHVKYIAAHLRMLWSNAPVTSAAFWAASSIPMPHKHTAVLNTNCNGL